jgi:MoaA/NifB/PqqE/SkfB family radical SAM enzyme
MHEIKIDKLNSLSLFIGTGKCNARCKHCAGVPLRKYAPKEDGDWDRELIYKTIKSCYTKGARSLSLSSSGEPTISPLSVTKVLKLLKECKSEGIEFYSINIYSNGILIGEDENFCKNYLPLWQSLGLTTIYITVHSIDEKKNAHLYGIKQYPSLKKIVSRIHKAGLKIRANIVLSKHTVYSPEDFFKTVKHLKRMNFDSISAWPIRDLEDRIDKELSPEQESLEKMKRWIKEEDLENYIRILFNKESRNLYKTGQKLTLFPDGTLSNTWCNN